MKLLVTGLEAAADVMREVEREGRVAVRAGLDAAAQGLKTEWRGQVEGAGLGSRLARTIRSQTFPRIPSSSAAAVVWSRAPVLMDAFDRGALIRSDNGFYLAIPTAAAGARGLGRKRITPGGWEQRTGMRLRFVYRRTGPSLLVADAARTSTRGLAVANKRKARRDGVQTGSQTIPIFILVPQVKLRKRLNLGPAAERWAAKAPDLIVQNWPGGAQ